VPIGFGPHGGEIWWPTRANNAVHASEHWRSLHRYSEYHLSRNTEGVYVIRTLRAPSHLLAASRGRATAPLPGGTKMFQLVWKYPLLDFTSAPIGGQRYPHK